MAILDLKLTTGIVALAIMLGSAQTRALAADQPELRLPDRLLGTWTSGGGFAGFGELRLTAENLSWADCMDEDYRVLRATQDGRYQIEVLQPCRIGVRSPFLIFEFSERALRSPRNAVEVWICRGREAFDHASARQFCSWGLLERLVAEEPG